MTTLLSPLEVHGPHGFDGAFSVLPFLGSFFLLLILLAGLAASYLWRHGKLTMPSFAARRSPEDEAKRILADRFARGDIGTDEFMERSSILNWTPGSEATQIRRPRKKRR
jgi:putative membrane protein